MANAPDLTLPTALLERLHRWYAEPQRHYHTLAHINALQAWFVRCRALAHEPELIGAAIWFHDAVYDTHRQDNEQRSAALAHAELSALVLATQHHDADPSDSDAWLFLDLDLSVLAQSAAHYGAYAQAVRAEYAWVDAAAYRSGRVRVLKGFLAREHIYRTPLWQAAWESRARRNLRREIAMLSDAA
jgi:predicted metal-dependent HD superfamily phosphohydrolase